MTDENNNLALFADDRFEPCRVCGEPSSGWHCGAVTCEACKVLFNKYAIYNNHKKFNFFLLEIFFAQYKR
jgi:hypothetical protein